MEIKVSFKVVGQYTTQMDYTTTCPPEVAKEIKELMDAEMPKKFPKPGQKTAQATLVVTVDGKPKTMFDEKMPLNKIAHLERGMVMALLKLINNHADA